MTELASSGIRLLGLGLLLVLVGVGCGGETGERPTTRPAVTHPEDLGSGPFSCAADDGYDLTLIEDFETGVASDGAWYTNNEICYRCVLGEGRDGGILPNSYPIVPVLPYEACRARCEASQDPNHFLKPIPAAEIQNGGRCGSHSAMRLRGPLANGPFTDWGVQFVRDMTGSPADVSSYEGVAFWARVGPDSRGILRFNAADKFSWEKYRDPATNASICRGTTSIDQYVPGSSTEGCDQAGSFFNVGPDWRFYALPFSEMRQAGWGKKAPYFDVWGIMAMGFLTGAGAWWDIWIDDVAWYRRKP